ncbi:hypothetical protein CBR_g49627 [Chara braunii]|uniref:Conserved oligomeric Golgi complex subunit 2 n=1 Tax=Chara braunii TaxID=69332 RepID=A0A388M5B1_CHABU|nr:hypothetical protein CBR_g49627 [Chara braunii]|eukprot:GBG89774.1 hypothetical protein CBR_g49627 [Chara braunii]
MAAVEAPGMVSMGPTNVAALFGDDVDTQPLWFKKDAFSDPDFEPDEYITDLRRFVPLETLRAELGSHLSVLKNELVELINRDYTDFVNLSTKLVDVDGAVLRMRMPLTELRSKLVSVRESVGSSLSLLQDGLRRRAHAISARQILELLLDTAHVLSKVEKLLLELTAMPEEDGPAAAAAASGGGSNENGDGIANGTHSDGNGNSDADEGGRLEESRSRLLERIASEMNRLKFYRARAEDMPFIQNMEKRIAAADGTLATHLRRCLEGGLEKRCKKVIYHCLRAYAAIDDTTGAEEAFRVSIVSPFVQQILQQSSSKGIAALAGDGLDKVYEQVLTRIETDCRFLLEIAYAANSGLHAFNFLSNSVLKEVHAAIVKAKPGAFSPGKPAAFLCNYKASLQFLSALEEYCPSQQAVKTFRSQAAYSDFMKQWNLSVYFTLRFQEIAGALDTALPSGSLTEAQGGPVKVENDTSEFLLHSSAVLWKSLQRCWHDDVFIPTVADKFLRLTLQLISRYTLWISAGLNARKVNITGVGTASGGEWATTATIEDFVLVRHDVDVVARLLESQYIDRVVAVLASMPAESLSGVAQCIRQSAQKLRELLPMIADIMKELLAEKSQEEFGRQLTKYNVKAREISSYVSLWQFVAPAERQSVDI